MEAIGSEVSTMEAIVEDSSLAATSLTKAIEQGWITSPELLNTPIEDNAFGRPPLVDFASKGNKDAVQTLLDAGAVVDAVDLDGNSALHRAISNGHLATARLLMDRKAKVDLKNFNGGSPLYVAACAGNVEAVRLLLLHKAKVDLSDDETNNPVHAAAFFGHVDIVKILSAGGAEDEIERVPSWTREVEKTALDTARLSPNWMTNLDLVSVEARRETIEYLQGYNQLQV